MSKVRGTLYPLASIAYAVPVKSVQLNLDTSRSMNWRSSVSESDVMWWWDIWNRYGADWGALNVTASCSVHAIPGPSRSTISMGACKKGNYLAGGEDQLVSSVQDSVRNFSERRYDLSLSPDLNLKLKP